MNISTLGIILGLIGGIGVPFIYIGNIKAVNEVQDVRIGSIEQQHIDNKEDFRILSAKVDALLIKEGINPSKIK